MKKILIAHLPWLLCIILVGLFLTRNLWATRAWIETHDGIYHLVRQEVFADSLKRGNFPVRWAGSLDNGFGLPLFNYIYPGPYYLGAPLSLLGLNSRWVIKIIEVGLYLIGGIGMYFLLARQSKFYATVSAILYLTTPYLLLNLFIRGALGEFMAISLLPWTLLALSDMAQQKQLRWYHPLPYFFLFIAHNFMSFLFLPIYAIVVYVKYREAWRLVFKSLLISLGLSAFFVLPMLTEQKYLFSIAKGDFTYNYFDHFVYPLQLFYSKWGNGFSYPGLADGFSMALGPTSLFVLVLGTWTSLKNKSLDLRLWLIVTAFILFFLLPVSLPIWNLVTPLQMMQFPWRLLSFTPLTIPLIAFYLLSRVKMTQKLSAIIVLFLSISLFFGFRYSTPFYFQNNDQISQQLYLDRTRTTTSSRLEILPRWGSAEARYIGEENIRIAHGSANIAHMTLLPEKITFTAESRDEGTIYRLRRNYFPSWSVKDETGKSYASRPTGDGLVDFTGSSGSHTYTVYVGSTGTELLANWISLLTLLYLLGRGLRPKFKNYLDSHFDGWDISIALRYFPIVDELKQRVRPNDKILEVGSEIRGITPYYPRHITGLDRGFDYTRRNQYLTPVEGTATQMPFKDRSFDYVISVDCIEHIPPKLRIKAMKEMLRVTKKRIYLTFPVGKQSEAIDRQLDDYFYRRSGEHFTYLTEHIDNGLPNFYFVPDIIAKYPGWTLTSKGNTSNWLWVLLLKMGFSNIQWQTSIYRRLLLFLPVLKHCNFGRCYRQLYILECTKS